MTESGVIVGTWSYMSPEQARGLPVDARSDIFALGVVFYEMLTGHRPFTGDTPTDVLSSIIKDAPPAISTIRAGIPRELARIVRRCLVKEPSRRSQSALDIRNDLEELKREIESGELKAEPQTAEARGAGKQAARWAAAAAAVAVLVVGSAYWWRRAERDGTGVIQLSNPRQVTFTSSVETSPTWSPDGGRIAYVSDQSGNEDIWVSPAAGGDAVNLTADHPGSDSEPSWSPDGNQIAFVSDRDQGGGHLRDAGNRRAPAPDFVARLRGRRGAAHSGQRTGPSWPTCGEKPLETRSKSSRWRRGSRDGCRFPVSRATGST